MVTERRGIELLLHADSNKSTAFTAEEREALGLRGLLPAHVSSQAQQQKRVMENLRRKTSNLERYILLLTLQGRTERLFYRTLIDHIDELMPIVYTPTVGQACLEFAHIFRQPRGFYICAEDRGRIRRIMDNWPTDDVRIIVVTDGQRILGLGDLGANGMGIPIGKLALYTACAGVDPAHCMPVMLDVGTNNEELLSDPLYLGSPMRRLEGEAYDTLVDEFVSAVQDKFPRALIQFEDFLTPNAYRLLERYRDRVLCFNDDIQGTAAVALAGIYASLRISGLELSELRIMFLGAGSAATGIADLLTEALMHEGLSNAEARQRLWFVDINGLVVESRTDLMPHNLPYAHAHRRLGFVEAIHAIRPHVLIGATGAPGVFTPQALEAMADINRRPTIFALSNPTNQAECTAEEAYRWTQGRAIFASGSPFAPVDYDGRTFVPAQGNNVYIFPGIGLGAIAVETPHITDEMFLAAARTLADHVDQHDLDRGSLYPPLKTLRDVSLEIAVALAEEAYASGQVQGEPPADLRGYISGLMYDPSY